MTPAGVPAARSPRWLALVALTLAALAYLEIGRPALPLATRVSDLTQLVLAVAAAVACLRAAARTQGAARAFWANLGLFAAVWGLGQLLWTWAARAGPPVRILPPWDMLFLISAVPAMAALLSRPDRYETVRRGLLLDAALLMVAAFHVYAFFGLGHWLAADQPAYAQWLGRVHAAKGLLVVATAVATAAGAEGAARRFFTHLAAALALHHLGAMASNAAMRSGAYHPGLLDAPWTIPFLWIAWLAVRGVPDPARREAPPENDWQVTRLGTVLSVAIVLIPPTLHLVVVQLYGATPEITRLRVPLTLATTALVALLAALRQLGNLRAVQQRVARREHERDAAEDARRRLEERYRGLVQSVNAVVWRAEPGTLRFTFVSDRAGPLLGYPVSDWTKPGFWVDRLHPDDREKAISLSSAAVAEGGSNDFRYRLVSASGKTVWVSDTVRVIRDLHGEKEAVGVMVDVTEQVTLEEALRQTQKMEAVGLLAGGIAHDFNNLLGVIIGQTELARRSLEPPHPARARVDEIHRAAERAAALTRQLLAFGRRQVVQPRILDLGELLGGMAAMLGRLLGEDVRLEIRTDGGRALVSADPSQVEQVIMNLAINARDAMPRGGRLLMRTSVERIDEDGARAHPGARPGAYARLQVSDEGIGMDAATLDRIFEPFFTTKTMGRGTGLGLSTVYGIVQQSEGHIAVRSAPGAGATFDVYLPLADGAAPAAESTPDPSAAAAAAGDEDRETVLVVEDEDGLRMIAREILEEAGYRVLEAADVQAAVAVASRAGRIDLVLSDVIMPGGSGPSGVARVRALHPRVKVLYMSGYSDLDDRHDELGPDSELIQKPFPSASLLARVRSILDR